MPSETAERKLRGLAGLETKEAIRNLAGRGYTCAVGNGT